MKAISLGSSGLISGKRLQRSHSTDLIDDQMRWTMVCSVSVVRSVGEMTRSQSH